MYVAIARRLATIRALLLPHQVLVLVPLAYLALC
jgi:hypothetical protein